MTYCSNAACSKPQNPPTARFCHHCGSPLLIVNRFRPLQPLGALGQSLIVRDEHLPSQPQGVALRLGDETQSIPYWEPSALLRLEQLSHQRALPRILAVVEQLGPSGGTYRGAQFLIHQWIEGENLAQRLDRQGLLSEAEVRAVMTTVLSALDELHQAQIIHGDLRPLTLVDGGAQVGLKLVSYRAIALPKQVGHPSQGYVTPAPERIQDLQQLRYRAPECLLGNLVLSSDLYSLGVTAIQLLTGKHPEKLWDLEEDCWRWEEDCAIAISEGLKAILNRLLQRATRQRYRQASEALAALQALETAQPMVLAAVAVPPDPDAFTDLETYTDLKPNAEWRATTEENLENLEDPEELENLEEIGELEAPEATAFQLEAEAPTQSPPDVGSEATNRTEQSLAQGDLAQLGASDLVAALINQPTQIPLGKLIEKLAQLQPGGGSVAYPPLMIWEQLDATHTDAPPPASQVASGLLNLADFYRERVNQGQRNLMHIVIAIAAYEQALPYLDRDASLNPKTYDDLGYLYWTLSRQQPNHRLRSLHRAVQTYRKGIQRCQVHPFSSAWIELHDHLGEAYGSLATLENPKNSWRLAVRAYEVAWTACQKAQLAKAEDDNDDIAPDERSLSQPTAMLAAAIPNNLGTAYWNLAQQEMGDRAANCLQQAIAAYTAAAAANDPETDPLRYGMIQNNLGTAYLHLGQMERSLDLLRLAVGTYQIALLYRTRTEAPLSHAATQNNLGASLLHLASHPYADPQTTQESLEQSVIAYDAALQMVRELTAVGATSFGFDPVATRLNLGLVHQRLGMLPQSSHNSNVTFAHLEMATQTYVSLLKEQPEGVEVHQRASDYLHQVAQYLSEEMGLAADHPLFQQLPQDWTPPKAELSLQAT